MGECLELIFHSVIIENRLWLIHICQPAIDCRQITLPNWQIEIEIRRSQQDQQQQQRNENDRSCLRHLDGLLVYRAVFARFCTARNCVGEVVRYSLFVSSILLNLFVRVCVCGT